MALWGASKGEARPSLAPGAVTAHWAQPLRSTVGRAAEEGQGS